MFSRGGEVQGPKASPFDGLRVRLSAEAFSSKRRQHFISPHPEPVEGRWRAAVLAASILALAAAAPALARDTPSGLPVPRWISLKSGKINARNGPGEDHRILWTYRVKDLPVQIVAETRQWRRVCDPRGGLAWVNVGTTSGRRTVLRLKPQPLPLRKQPDASAPVTAYLGANRLAGLDRCKDGWCKIKAGGSGGWAPAAEFWGTADGQLCQAARR